MRVLNVMSRFNVGGTAQWLYQLSKGLGENQIENLLIIGDCPINEREDPRISEISHLRIKGLGPKTSPISTLRAFFSLRREIKKYRPDIVNTHTSKAGVLGRIAARTSGIDTTIVHTYHGHVLSGYFNKFLEFVIRFIESALSWITDFFLISGEQVAQDLQSSKIVRGQNYLHVFPAVPDFSLENRESARRELGIGRESTVFGWLGRKVPIKRLDRIIDLAVQNPEAIFVIAGDGESVAKTYPSQITAKNIKNIIEIGYTSPSKLWAIADICLLTSDNEAMPISPIEAALAGRTVIAIDSGSTREVLINEKTGFLCRKDSDEIFYAVKEAIAKPKLRVKMGSAGREFALAKFSPEASIRRQIEGYRLALASKRGPRD